MQKQLTLNEIDEDVRIDDNYPTMAEDEEKETCPKCHNEEPEKKKCRKCWGAGYLTALILLIMFSNCSCCNTHLKKYQLIGGNQWKIDQRARVKAERTARMEFDGNKVH